jgi:hypothetical protein
MMMLPISTARPIGPPQPNVSPLQFAVAGLIVSPRVAVKPGTAVTLVTVANGTNSKGLCARA